MRLEQLKCLVDIAQTGSITGTAQRMYATQQAVSKSIKQLEKELGVDILVRTNAGVRLTPMGEKVLKFAQLVLDEEAYLRQEIRDSQIALDTEEISMQISSTSSVTNLVLPNLIAKLHAQQVAVQVNVVSLPDVDDVLHNVRSGISDIGLMTINGRELQRKLDEHPDTLEMELLMRDDMVAVMDRRQYSGEKTAITELDFNQAAAKTLYNIIPVDDMREHIYLNNVICSNDADFHRSMMEKAGAITLMSGLAYQYYFNSKKYVALKFEGLMNQAVPELVHVAVYRKNAGEPIHRFVAMIRKEMLIK